MTAVLKYQRLEATGIWRPNPRARLRDVIVTVGDATLVLMDPRSETPLTHWSLPAVTRLNPAQLPAIYGPSAVGTDEVLEIEDPLMVAAIEKVQTALEGRRGKRGRLRGAVGGAVAAAVLLAGVLWLPGAIIDHAAKIAPPAQRDSIGRTVLTELEKVTGPACRRSAGATVLDRLTQRLGLELTQIVVVPETLRGARNLPGGIIVIGDDLLAAQTAPDVVAGHILTAHAAAQSGAALDNALDYAGAFAALSLMLRGYLPQDALVGYGEQVATHPLPAPLNEGLVRRFAALGISPEPYLLSVDPDHRDTASWALISQSAARPPARPILSGGEWSQLRHICDS